MYHHRHLAAVLAKHEPPASATPPHVAGATTTPRTCQTGTLQGRLGSARRLPRFCGLPVSLERLVNRAPTSQPAAVPITEATSASVKVAQWGPPSWTTLIRRTPRVRLRAAGSRTSACRCRRWLQPRHGRRKGRRAPDAPKV